MEQIEESGATSPYRLERDFLGQVRVPAAAYYGVHTVRALAAYGRHGRPLSGFREFLCSYGRVKVAAAIANRRLGVLQPSTADAVVAAAREVADGRWDGEFPVNALQGGGGVATNMNVNEVIANRANEMLGGRRGGYDLVHPNDHANRSQSTNDTYPTALNLAVLEAGDRVMSGLEVLADRFTDKAVEFGDLERLGRTCLRDALPLTVRQTHQAHAAVVQRGRARVAAALAGLHSVPLGATAVGTGAGAPVGYRDHAVGVLAEEAHRSLLSADDPFDALQHLDVLVDVAAAMASIGATLSKIASDLRLLSSGPVGGFNEVTLPPLQAGSSIMPGKTNPAAPELVIQIALRLRGASHVIEGAAASGELELNAMGPTVLTTLIPALWETEHMVRVFGDQCVSGLAWNRQTVTDHLEGSQLDKVLTSVRDGYSAVK